MTTIHPAADYNARILHPLAAWIRERHGEGALTRIAGEAGVSREALGSGNQWIDEAAFETFLVRSRELFPGDEAFKAAAVHRMAEGYGLMRYLLWASSPGGVLLQAARSYRLMSRVGRLEIVSWAGTACHVRIRRSESERPISRLACLVRQAQTSNLPTMLGLPPALLRETACVAHGDAACEYHLRWFDRRRWLPPVVGLVLGGACAAVVQRMQGAAGAAGPGWLVLPLLGALVGVVLELQRANRENVAFGAEQNRALLQLAEEEAEARRELLEVHRRQHEWSQQVEQDAAERALTIQNVLARIERSQQVRDQQLRGFSHDLNSPLSVMRIGLELLEPYVRGRDGEGETLLQELNDSLVRVSRLLGELMVASRARSTAVQLTPEDVDVEALTERLRRRLRAMVQRREVRTSVVRTRAAPSSVFIDPLLLDRITDNLLSNAAKYTERGSIVVEVDGNCDQLVLKVLDSGKGIEPDRIDQAFVPEGSEVSGRAANSYGLGLSVVVRLLAEVGGRLEVMSAPNEGTTFWAYLPVAGRDYSAPPSTRDSAPSELVAKVVRIRRHERVSLPPASSRSTA